MSRIGRRPIETPPNVKVEFFPNNLVKVTGPNGTLTRQFAEDMAIAQQGNTLLVTRPDDSQSHRAMHGLTRTLLANMVTGVSAGFRKDLEINGNGYRVQLIGKSLVFQVGYSHLVQVDPPEGVVFIVDSPTKCSVTGIDKEVVGQIAAQIRAIRKPEPYKGKGIKYAQEVIRRKVGKKK